jgi:CRISPR system Cascade subunit CasA
MRTFDLSEQGWIPSLSSDGQACDLGLFQTLVGAHKLRELADPSPLVNAAALCLLLAILHDCWNPRTLDDFEDHWTSLWEAQRFPTDVLQEYFARRRDRFDLFHPVRPFYQIADLEIGRIVKKRAGAEFLRSSAPVARLLTEAASGNNAALFDHRSDEEPDTFAPAQAARALLVTHAFALGFGKASTAWIGGVEYQRPYSADAILLRGLTIWLSGDNLLETLLLNYSGYVRHEDDRAAWDLASPYALMDRQNGKQRTVVPPRGRLDQLTWQSRLVRLIPEADQQGRTVIRSIYFTQGRSADKTTEHPMKTYRRDPKEGFKPLGLSANKAAWRDAQTLFQLRETGTGDRPAAALLHASTMALLGRLQKKHTLGFNVVGLATAPNKAGKFLLWRQERIPLPRALLQDAEGEMLRYVSEAVEYADRIASWLRGRTREIAAFYLAPDMDQPNARQPDMREVDRLARSIDSRQAYWSRLEDPFHRFLLRFESPGPTEALKEWKRTVNQEARVALRQAIRALGFNSRVQRAVARAEARRERRREHAAGKDKKQKVAT